MAKNANKELIRTLYNKVQEKKAVIANAEKGTYLTDGLFRFGNNAQVIDIKTERNKNRLKEILSFLLEKEAFDGKANEILGLKEPFAWMNVSLGEWTKDLKTRVAQLSIVESKASLQADEAALLSMDATLLQEIKLEEMKSRLG